MSLTPSQQLALALDPALMFTARGLTPDPWQRDLLHSTRPRILLNCCRQAGKSTAVAALGLHTILFRPHSLVLLVSPSQRQSGELFRKILDFYRALKRPLPATAETTLTLELENGSRVVSLPGDEDTIRGYSGVNLLIVDEAARVPDNLYQAIRPMLAVSGGRLLCLSTPNGRRGFFYHAWKEDSDDWEYFEVPAIQVPRISAGHLERDRRSMPPVWFKQEYECRFETPEGLVYPEMPACVVAAAPLTTLSQVGGLDFGFRDPNAAIWGFHDKQTDVLWLTGEYYGTNDTLAQLSAALPRGVMWHADPSAALQIRELKRANHKVARSANALVPGIAAVAARIRSGRLKIVRSACPHLLAEAELYQWEPETGKPYDRDNHVLDALRYLVVRLDAGFQGRSRPTGSSPDQPSPAKPRWPGLRNEELWTRVA